MEIDEMPFAQAMQRLAADDVVTCQLGETVEEIKMIRNRSTKGWTVFIETNS